MLLDWVLWIILLWLELNKNIVFTSIDIEFLTELSLINWVFTSNWFNKNISCLTWCNLWLWHHCNCFIETVLLNLNEKISSCFRGYNMVLTVPILSICSWSWLIFTPCEFFIHPCTTLISCYQDIFCVWAFVRSLLTGPFLYKFILDLTFISTVVKRFLTNRFCAEIRSIRW